MHFPTSVVTSVLFFLSLVSFSRLSPAEAMKLFITFSRFVALLVLATFLAVSSAVEGTINVVVVTNLTRATFTSSQLSESITRYVEYQKITDISPTVISSEGSLLETLVSLSEVLASSPPDVIVVGDTTLITMGVVNLLSELEQNSSVRIPLITIAAATDELCDVEQFPSVVCLSPVDSIVQSALLQMEYAQLGWLGTSSVVSNSFAGRQRLVEWKTAFALDDTPSLVATFNTSLTSTEILAGIVATGSSGVTLSVSDDEMMDLVDESPSSGVYLIGDKSNINVLAQSESTNYALFIPHYMTAAQLASTGYYTTSDVALDEMGAYTISYVLDALQLIHQIGVDFSSATLQSVNFTGLTGTVHFEPVSLLRSGCPLHLVTPVYSVSNPVITVVTSSSLSAGSTVVLQADYVSATIPASSLNVATICFVIPKSCVDVSFSMSVLYTILLQDLMMSTSLLFNIRAVDIGLNGVDGFTNLLSVAHECTLIVGSGHSKLDSVLSPIVNNYNITQLDYQAASSLLTQESNALLPSFSRTVPLYSYSEKGFAEVCRHFGWERVVIISGSDSFGLARSSEAMTAMISRNIFIESVYKLQETTRSSLLSTMKTIYAKAVSRIVVISMPFIGDDAEMFFDLIDEASYMSNYVFLLDSTLCAYGAFHPDARNKLQSSICMFPDYNSVVLQEMNTAITQRGLQAEASEVLTKYKVESDTTCSSSYTSIHAEAAFAVDVGLAVLTAVQNAISDGVSLYNSSNLLSYVHGQSFVGLSGSYSIDSLGNRDTAVYLLNIQTPSSETVTFASWGEGQSPNFHSYSVKKWKWMTGSVAVPLDTFRDASFVLQNAAFSSPGAIAISVVGFVVTIFAFAMCYRHYHIQHKIKKILRSNAIPITETELQYLRGQREV